MASALHSLQIEIEDLREQLARSEARNVRLHELLHQALHREFGASTEKVSAEQARLFDELDGVDDEPTESSVEPTLGLGATNAPSADARVYPRIYRVLRSSMTSQMKRKSALNTAAN